MLENWPLVAVGKNWEIRRTTYLKNVDRNQTWADFTLFKTSRLEVARSEFLVDFSAVAAGFLSDFRGEFL